MSNENRVNLMPDDLAQAKALAARGSQAGQHSRSVEDGNGLGVIRTPRIIHEMGPSGPRRVAVCTAMNSGADLWIKPEDDDDLIVVLMEMITDSELEVKGWIAVGDGRGLGYRIGQDVFVPQFHLNDPSVLRARA